jgi:hypothetical protein
MIPLFAALDDVHKYINYLKNKPTGATTAEIKATLGNVTDPRKIGALVHWKLVEKSGEKLKLADRGWRMARRPGEEQAVFKEIIDSIVPYRSVVEWAYHQGMTELSSVDVAAHWHEHHSKTLETDNERTLKDGAVCFFHVCQGAGLGKLIVGRRGQPTRLELYKEELEATISAGPSSLPTSDLDETPIIEDEGDGAAQPAPDVPGTGAADQGKIPEKPTDMRIFIAHGKNMTLVDQVETMLSLASFKSEVAEDEETTAIPVPEKVFAAMRRCQAGIIIVSADEADRDSGGQFSINQNVLIEIGAAFVLYDRKVVLVWDKRLTIPSNLQGLYRCEFEGAEFSWTAGMKLMKAMRDFRK